MVRKNVLCSIILFVCLISLNSNALNELNFFDEYNQKVKPLLMSMTDAFFKSNGISIHYKELISENAHSCLVILPGRSEPAEKYGELIYDLKQTDFGKGLNFFILDHRGQGSSDRLTAIRDLGYVDSFNNYVTDLDLFLKSIVGKVNCQKKFLFAHSMGAGIALTYLSSHESPFAAVAVSSPMLKINTKPYPYVVAEGIVSSMVAVGKGATFALGQKGYDPNATFEANTFTTSKVRFEATKEIFNEFPQTRLGGVSNQWVNEVMKGTVALRESYKSIKVPLRMYRAGIELYSDSNEMQKMCKQVERCEELYLPTSKHEVVNDKDENRQKVITSMIDFFQEF
ncbi:MAG: alpha/beta fold hydrolase [Pseudobdellovibrionaceae bacterium]